MTCDVCGVDLPLVPWLVMQGKKVARCCSTKCAIKAFRTEPRHAAS